jgi:hypothetical protein
MELVLCDDDTYCIACAVHQHCVEHGMRTHLVAPHRAVNYSNINAVLSYNPSTVPHHAVHAFVRFLSIYALIGQAAERCCLCPLALCMLNVGNVIILLHMLCYLLSSYLTSAT